MEQGDGEKEALAVALQDRLTQFASSQTTDREQALPELYDFIRKNVKGELLKVKPAFQSELEQATDLTLKTPFDVNGEEVNPWSGGFTVVVLDNDGKISGADSVPTEGLEEYGDLHPYALGKAVFLMHLEKAGRKGGLDHQENYDYIKGLFPREVTIYTGSARESLVVEGQTYYLGASGCAVTEAYLTELLGGAKPSHGTQGGRFDGIFSDLAGFYMFDGKLSKPIKYQEPASVKDIRRNN